MVLAALAASAALAACKPDQGVTGDAAKEAMGLYAKGYNLLLTQPSAMVKSYFHTLSEDGPAAGARPHLQPAASWAQKTVKEAREAFATAQKAAPSALAKLGPASDRALTANDQAIAVELEAEKYYEAEGYKSDQLAKGKELHAKMVAARKELSAAMGALEDGLSEVEDAQAVADLKNHEADKGYSYWFRYFNLEAKNYLAAVRDPAKRAAATQAIRAAHDALAAFVAGKGSELSSYFSTYAASADSFWAACQKFERQGQGVAAETGDAEQGLIAAYNGLIKSGNFLYKLESTDSLK
jgi:hypothetical protein